MHRLEHLNKMLYLGYMRFLNLGHRYRSAQRAGDFYGKSKRRRAPERPTVEFWKQRWKDVEDKVIELRDSGMRQLSIFHTVPYFKVNMVP